MFDMDFNDIRTVFIGISALGGILAMLVAVSNFLFTKRRDYFTDADELTDEEFKLWEQRREPAFAEEFKALSDAEQSRLKNSYDANKFFRKFKKIEKKESAYHSSLERLGRFFKHVIGDTPKEGSDLSWPHRWFGAKVFTVKSFEFCLGLSLSYPLIFALASWLISGELSIAGVLFGEPIDVSMRWALGILLLILLFTAGIALMARNTWKKLPLSFLLFLGVIAFLGFAEGNVVVGVFSDIGGFLGGFVSRAIEILGGDVAFGADFARDYAMGLIVAYAIFLCLVVFVFISVFVALASSGVGVFAFTIFSVGTVVVGVTVAAAGGKGLDMYFLLAMLPIIFFALFGGLYVLSKKVKRMSFFWIAYTVINLLFLCYYFALFDKRQQYVDSLIFPLFLGLLPLVNVVFDWLSLNVTRGLFLHLYKNTHKLFLVYLIFLLDFFIAIFFMFLITTSLSVVLATINMLSAEQGQPPFDYYLLMQGLEASPMAAEHLWVHFMVLSTVVPTFIHLFFALMAVVLWPLKGALHSLLEGNNYWDSVVVRDKVYNYIYMLKPLAVWFSFTLAGVVLYIVIVHFFHVMQGLWWVGDRVFDWLDPTYGLSGLRNGG